MIHDKPPLIRPLVRILIAMVAIDPKYDIPRDLEGKSIIQRPRSTMLTAALGFGETPIDPHWPNGARIAVSFVLNYE